MVLSPLLHLQSGCRKTSAKLKRPWGMSDPPQEEVEFPCHHLKVTHWKLPTEHPNGPWHEWVLNFNDVKPRRFGGCFRSSFQLLSHIQLFATPWTTAPQASLSITNSWSLLKLMSIGSVMPSNHLILCCPLLLLPSIFPSIRVFSNESVLHIRWPKYWSFSFSIRPPNEYSGLISFRIDCFDLLAVQGTLKSLLQHHNFRS